MADLVESVLQAAAEKEARFKSTEVHKDLDAEIDEGNLLLVDQNPVEVQKFRKNKEQFFKNLARDDAQLLINKIWELPIERIEGAVVAQLPRPRTLLPREKPVPKKKKETKWEKYAQLKGINNKKKGRKIWDEDLKQWVPRWGYKRGTSDNTKDWVIEVPKNQDPMSDMFGKRVEAKKERVAKNELQRLRNIARNKKGKVPGVGLTPTEKPDKDHIAIALREAKRSTASVGKFTDALAKEKRDTKRGKHRKFQSNIGDMGSEKKNSLDIFNKVQNNVGILNVNKAVNQELLHDDQQRSRQVKPRAGGKGKGKGKGNFMGKGKGKAGGGGKGKSGGGKGKGNFMGGKGKGGGMKGGKGGGGKKR